MIDAEEVNKYLIWKRDKDLYPPRWLPEDYIQYLIAEDSVKRMTLLADYLAEEVDDPFIALSNIHALVFDPIEEEVEDE